MSADRIVGLGALILGVALYALAGDSEAYLFPRAIAIAIGILGLAILGTSVARLGRAQSAKPVTRLRWLGILPVLVIFLAYRWAMEAVGFYAAAFAAFLVVAWVYAPERPSPRAAAVRIAISAGFVGTLFAVFFLLLRVQTPRGVLF